MFDNYAGGCYQLNQFRFAIIRLKKGLSMAQKLGLLMLAGLGFANASQILLDNCADKNAFGCQKPVVSFGKDHHDEHNDHVHLLGEKEVSLGWQAKHGHIGEVLHQESHDNKDHDKGDSYGHLHTGPLYYYYYPGSRYYYTRSDHSEKGWVRHDYKYSKHEVKGEWKKDHDGENKIISKNHHKKSDHKDCDKGDCKYQNHIKSLANHHHVVDHHHKQPKPVIVSAKPAVLAVAEVSQVPRGYKATPVHIIHTSKHSEPIPEIDFEPTNQRPVILTEGDIKAPIGIVSVPNVATVHFDKYHPAINERLGRSDCPECDSEKDARIQKKHADRKLAGYKDKLSTEIEGPIDDVSAYAKDHEHFYLHTHEFDDCPHPVDSPHIHLLGPHRFLHHKGKVYFYDHSIDHHAAQHQDEHGHQHLSTHHYESEKDIHYRKEKASAEMIKAHKEAIQFKEIAHDLAKGQAREDAVFKVGEVNYLEPKVVKHKLKYHDYPHH